MNPTPYVIAALALYAVTCVEGYALLLRYRTLRAEVDSHFGRVDRVFSNPRREALEPARRRQQLI